MTYKLVGFDTFEGEYYDLDGEYSTETEAITAGRARLLELEKNQPSSSSGGQGFGGIQDRVFVLCPNGQRKRLL